MIVLFYTILLIRNLGQQRQGEVMLQKCSLFPLFCQKSKNQKNISTQITD